MGLNSLLLIIFIMHECPTCGGKFRDFPHGFPLVYVSAVSLKRPDEVPKAIPDFYYEDLLEKETAGWKRNIIPTSILQYFNEHPDEDDVVHSDGFIYERPWQDKKESRQVYGKEGRQSEVPKFWARRINHAPMARDLMENNEALNQYFNELRLMVGKNVPIEQFTPSWQRDIHVQKSIPGADGLRVLIETDYKINRLKILKVVLYAHGSLTGGGYRAPTSFSVLQLGHIEIEGIVPWEAI
jgi:hypothetical protein